MYCLHIMHKKWTNHNGEELAREKRAPLHKEFD